MDWLKFPCIEVTQPIGAFFIGSIPAADLLEIARADIRRIEGRDVEKYVGIQRPLNTARVRELQQYVTTIDATFPTSIILAVRDENARFDKRLKELSIMRKPDAASILDGQHRIAGLENYKGPTFELNVTVFVDMDLQDQAMTFGTINITQTKVNRSLVYDLYEFQKARSPQKTCHNIARLLNRENGSPLGHRIKVLGQASGEEFQFITQATFVDCLIVYITRNAQRDRDDIRRGRKPEPASEAEAKQQVLRPLFLDDRDPEIAKIIWTLFDVVAARWPEAWNSKEPGFMLNRTNGFRAIMRVFGPLYRMCADGRGRLPRDAVVAAFKKSSLRSNDFNTARYSPGTTGESALAKELIDQMGLD